MIHVEETTFQAKTVEECLSQAENKFGISKGELKYNIVQEPREGDRKSTRLNSSHP